MTQLKNPCMHFEVIKDYRQAAKVEHKLSDIILLTICGVLSGLILGRVSVISVKVNRFS